MKYLKNVFFEINGLGESDGKFCHFFSIKIQIKGIFNENTPKRYFLNLGVGGYSGQFSFLPFKKIITTKTVFFFVHNTKYSLNSDLDSEKKKKKKKKKKKTGTIALIFRSHIQRSSSVELLKYII